VSNNLKPTLARLASGATLTADEAEHAFDVIMSGEATPAQIGALLMAMRVRGETVPELTGAVRAMRNRMTAIAAPDGAIDVCGTGGDNAGTLNVSTAVTFVLAGAGVPVAKHGNRALSSRTGGADVLTALGVNVDAPLDRLPDILRAANCVFLFAPRHHPSMRHAAGPRVELGTRTIFNLLGPLANPARVRRQLTGVFAPEWARPMAETLGALGSTAAWIVHGQGLDELTVAGENQVTALRDGNVTSFTVTPEDAGLARAPVEAIRGGDAALNAASLTALLEGAPGPYRDTVVLNAAAALIVAGRAGDLREGVGIAADTIASGAALGALQTLRRETTLGPASGPASGATAGPPSGTRAGAA
jgi:anthranilate phosphoribosyltransferase